MAIEYPHLQLTYAESIYRGLLYLPGRIQKTLQEALDDIKAHHPRIKYVNIWSTRKRSFGKASIHQPMAYQADWHLVKSTVE